MKINSKSLILCIVGAVWPLGVIPFMMLNHLNYSALVKTSLPAITILIAASLGVLPFGYGLYTFMVQSRSRTVAILISVALSAILYCVYSGIFAYYILFSYGSF
jgi:hypothetical protein